jgi:hypothetical protein
VASGIPSVPETSAPAVEEAKLTGLRALVVDDNRVNRMVVYMRPAALISIRSRNLSCYTIAELYRILYSFILRWSETREMPRTFADRETLSLLLASTSAM